MTRHFLRDRNGEEAEIPSQQGDTLNHNRMFVSRDGINWCLLKVCRIEIVINQKLEFIVWQEV